MVRTIIALTCVVLEASTVIAQTCEPAVGTKGQADVRLIVQSLYAGDVDVVLKYTTQPSSKCREARTRPVER